MSTKLSGVVDLDYKQALAGLRAFRGELKAVTKDPTTVKVALNDGAAKGIGQLKRDLAGLSKLGPEHSIKLTATADTKAAALGLTSIKSLLVDIGKNPKVTISVDVSSAKRGIGEVSDEQRKATEARKQDIRAEASQRRRALDDEKAGIRDAAKEQARADLDAMASAKAVTAERKRAIAEGKAAASELGDKLSRVATGGGLALLGGLGYATKKAVDFEDSFASVRKTVSGTDKDLDGLALSLRKMSTQLPTSAEDLNSIAANAGQLGISGTKNILQFTKVVSQLSTATSLTTDEAATGMAKLGNILQLPSGQFDRLGSTIARLGNIGASTEGQILGLAQRIAGAGKQVGMTPAQILSVSNALTSLGIEAEAGGTSFSRLLQMMQKSSATGSKQVQEFAKIAGMSTADFKRYFDKDATGAVTRFLDGLGKLPKGQIFAALDSVGVKSSRMVDTLGRATGAISVLKDSLREGDKAWANNSTLQEMTARRLNTTANQFKITRNEVDELARSVGDAALPAERDLLKAVDGTLRGLNNLSSAQREGAVKWALYGGAALLATGQLKGVIEAGFQVGKVFVLMNETLATARAAKLASAAAAQALAVADGEAAVAATALAEAEGAAGAGAVTGAAGAGAFGVGFLALSAAAVVATGAIGLYKINQEAVAQNNTRLDASNKGLAVSNKGVSASFDALSKSAKGNGEAATAVSKLRAEYEKMSKTDLKGFAASSIPSARAEILLNTRLMAPDKDALSRQIDDLQARVNDQLDAKKFKISVKTEADEGALSNLKKAFYDTYGELYAIGKDVFLMPYVKAGEWAFGQVGYVAKVSFDGIASGMKGLRVGLADAWYSMTGGFESGFNKMLRGLSDSITGFLGRAGQSIASNTSYYWKMANGQTANYGETNANSHSMAGYGSGFLAQQKQRHAAWLKGQVTNPNDFKAGGGGLTSKSDIYGDPGNVKPKVTPLPIAPKWTPPAPSGKSKADTREENALLKQQKDALGDAARGYDLKAKAAKDSAKDSIDAAKTELDKLKELRDSFKDTFRGDHRKRNLKYVNELQ